MRRSFDDLSVLTASLAEPPAPGFGVLGGHHGHHGHGHGPRSGGMAMRMSWNPASTSSPLDLAAAGGERGGTATGAAGGGFGARGSHARAAAKPATNIGRCGAPVGWGLPALHHVGMHLPADRHPA